MFRIAGTHVVDVGQEQIVNADPVGFDMEVTSAADFPRLIVRGLATVNASGPTPANGLFYGISSGNVQSGFDSYVLIESGGTLRILSTIATGRIQGFSSAGRSTRLQNDGVIEVIAANGAYGVSSSALDQTVSNAGMFKVEGRGAVGVYYQNGGIFTNSGTLDVISTAGAGMGYWDNRLQDFTNNGLIRVTDNTVALDSVALRFDHLGPSYIVNSGTLQGDYAIRATREFSPATNYSTSITNNGVIRGIVDFSLKPSAETLINYGTMVGDVFLGAGGDRFDSAVGVITGSVFGGAGADILIGSAGADRLYGDELQAVGGAGADTLAGGEGDDFLFGGDAADTLYGEAGNDILFGDAGDDSISGGLGTDTFYGGDGIDRLYGEDGNDVMAGGLGDDLTSGGLGDDLVYGEDGADILYGDAGSDSLDGGAGADQVFGQDGNDALYGGLDNDSMAGGVGDDSIDGGVGIDTLYGEAGIDRLYGGDGNDALSGGAETDFFDGGLGNDALYGDDGNDFIYAGVGDDSASGGTGNDNAFGEDGNDGLYGDEGDDSLDGQNGNDALVGGAGNDNLYGSAGDDTLLGGANTDNLSGGANNDVLIGGAGQDLLLGGTGADRFVFQAISDSAVGVGDQILDFSSAEGDVIDISAIDANSNVASDQAFSFVSAFSGQAGQAVLSFDTANNRTLLTLDVNGDSAADFALLVNGNVTSASVNAAPSGPPQIAPMLEAAMPAMPGCGEEAGDGWNGPPPAQSLAHQPGAWNLLLA